nr:uncharacterized protein LOC123284517 [Equus asinus]
MLWERERENSLDDYASVGLPRAREPTQERQPPRASKLALLHQAEAPPPPGQAASAGRRGYTQAAHVRIRQRARRRHVAAPRPPASRVEGVVRGWSRRVGVAVLLYGSVRFCRASLFPGRKPEICVPLPWPLGVCDFGSKTPVYRPRQRELRRPGRDVGGHEEGPSGIC